MNKIPFKQIVSKLNVSTRTYSESSRYNFFKYYPLYSALWKQTNSLEYALEKQKEIVEKFCDDYDPRRTDFVKPNLMLLDRRSIVKALKKLTSLEKKMEYLHKNRHKTE
ncbi:uncharacterized protein LOC119665612 [Teleopsis dalmanni]|uniref:uncharacterized protein LOC119665612 n=1 Tax=Teleopsis dalmanni TaxID=139649 RepID=UPI000D32979C|nr:uncharacterized protein LOC119665612 [Teleopsis dalmanni]